MKYNNKREKVFLPSTRSA